MTAPSAAAPDLASNPSSAPISNEEIELTPAPFPSLPPAFAIRAAIAIRRWLHALADRLVPSGVALIEHSFGHCKTQLLGAAARLGIADLLAEGPLDAYALAEQTGTSADALHRTLRALATLGIFRLRSDGRFENNRLSRGLLATELVRARDFARYSASRSNAAAWCDFERTVATGASAFPRVNGMSVWRWFDEHESERETFAHAMMGLTVLDAPMVARLYPFAEIKRLCDVGGGRGTLLSDLCIRHPHLRGVLCDGEGVIASARSLLAKRGVADRVDTVAGSFFERVPEGCDAYLLKNILHDWDDERAETILATCRRSMRPGDRMLIVEAVVERHDTRGLGALADVQMMVVADEGRERGRDEFTRLLAATGFRFTRLFPSPTVSVIEGIAI